MKGVIFVLGLFYALQAVDAAAITITGSIEDGRKGSAFTWYNPAGSPNPKFGILNYPNSTFTLTIDEATGQVESFTGTLLTALMFEGFLYGGTTWGPSQNPYDFNTVKFSYTNEDGFAERENGFTVTARNGVKGTWFSNNTGAYGVPTNPAQAVHLAGRRIDGVFANFRLLNGLLTDYSSLLGKDFLFNSFFTYGGTGQLNIHVLGTITKVSGGGTVGTGDPSPIPEPSSLLLLGVAICGGISRRRTSRRAVG